MTQDDVAGVCPSCAERMAALNVRRIRASVLFGVDDPERVVEAARNRTAGNKWQKLPKGWTDESRKKMWNTLTGDRKHKVTACIKKMTGKVEDPGAFCASLADRVEGKGWRSERSASEDTMGTQKLVEATEQFKAATAGPMDRAIEALDKTAKARFDAAIVKRMETMKLADALIAGAKMVGAKGTMKKLELLKDLTRLEMPIPKTLLVYRAALHKEVLGVAKKAFSPEDYAEFEQSFD